MCGRYTLHSGREALQDQFGVEFFASPEARYNIAPSQNVNIIYIKNDLLKPRVLGLAHWGLIPSWSRDAKIAQHTINARAETVAEKPSYRSAFKKRRCLIPADGFYEWQKTGDGKQPYYIKLPDNKPFAFAGLWEVWHDPQSSEVVPSCSIITTTANAAMTAIHQRMPVILSDKDYDSWLDPEIQDANRLQNLLQHRQNHEMKIYPVSKFVNRVQNNSTACIKPLSDD